MGAELEQAAARVRMTLAVLQERLQEQARVSGVYAVAMVALDTAREEHRRAVQELVNLAQTQDSPPQAKGC